MQYILISISILIFLFLLVCSLLFCLLLLLLRMGERKMAFKERRAEQSEENDKEDEATWDNVVDGTKKEIYPFLPIIPSSWLNKRRRKEVDEHEKDSTRKKAISNIIQLNTMRFLLVKWQFSCLCLSKRFFFSLSLYIYWLLSELMGDANITKGAKNLAWKSFNVKREFSEIDESS